MQEIKLTQNRVALVDDNMFEFINKWKWQYHEQGYAFRTEQKDGVKRGIYMHIVIMGDKGIDHIDGDKLNNQRHNLRFASRSENQWNKSIQKNNKSGVKGLFYNPTTSLWTGKIRCFGKAYTKRSKCRAIVEAWLLEKRVDLHGAFAKH